MQYWPNKKTYCVRFSKSSKLLWKIGIQDSRIVFTGANSAYTQYEKKKWTVPLPRPIKITFITHQFPNVIDNKPHWMQYLNHDRKNYQ